MAKKIAIIIPDVNVVGGAEFVAKRLATNLVNEGYAVTLVSLFSSDKNSYSDDFLFTIRHLNLIKPKTLFQRLKLIFNRMAMLNDYDVVIGNNTYRYYLSPYWNKSHKKIEIQHMCYQENYFDNSFQSKFKLAWRNFNYSFLDGLVCLTNKDAKRFEYKGIKNTTVIENFIDVTDLKKGKDCHSYKRCVSFGRLTEQKGFERIFDLWSKISRDFPEWKWDIYGEGELEQHLRNELSVRGISESVTIRNFTTMVDKEMETSSILLFPSRYEGFPLTLLEAMSCGLPCISFDCDSGPSEIIINGENGYVVEDNDLSSFEVKLRELISQPSKLDNMSSKAIESVEKFGWKKIKRKWQYVLDE
ncbi:glycosyltransferase family 4 protein [Vibrio parahaemolyticus]|uniref:glycosyltransferase family 4 protein n=1 Tax=Vibrio campbellii TaxID=680 RepID=UPI0003A79743|nr:glycosyltransferase family 4 protein [Vibrio campbellii]MDF5669198.1 glycosyltransferase family 4 protein [Vibrio parahaemolyticus]MDG2729297.1 glycosyltransferase family 4 protein [Vibrio parahaemolyticus]